MPVTFDASEVNKLAADLATGRDRVGAATSRVVRESAKRIEDSARAKAPQGPTGDLKASMGTDLYGDGRSGGMTAVVGPAIRYARFVENGTSKMAAQPFLGPAFAEESPRFAEEMGKAAGEVLS